MKKVLITGAAGFIGSHLVRFLLQAGDSELCLVDNLRRGRRDDEFETLLSDPRVRFVEADLSEPQSFSSLGSGYDEVYHLAAVIGVSNVMERPYDVVRLNALTTLHLLDWMARGGGKKILFSSTSEAYAWTQNFFTLPIPTPEDVPVALTDLKNPRSSYAGSKIFGELAVTHACQVHGLNYTIVRYHNVYGPRMGYNHVIPELFHRVSAGESPLKVYNAHHTRAFCYVEDAITATHLAMTTPAANGITINVGNDREEVTVGDLAVRLVRASGLACELQPEHAAHDPIARRCPDISKARKLLGFEPAVSLDEGLIRTITWYRQHPKP